MIEPSLLICAVNNWIGLAKNLKRSRIEFTIYMIAQDPMLQSRPANNY